MVLPSGLVQWEFSERKEEKKLVAVWFY